MQHLEVILLPGGGELTVIANTEGGVYVSIHSRGVAVSFGLTQENVAELRAALGQAVMARLEA
jgi:hypothetical protein